MSLKLADVDDYINPSQACINPLFTSDRKSNKNDDRDKKTGNPAKNESVSSTNTTTAGTSTTTTTTTVNSESTNNNHVITMRRRRRVGRRIRLESTHLPPGGDSTAPQNHENFGGHEESMPWDKTGIPLDDASKGKSTQATVSVSDCLACSGCITSAEAVLVTTRHCANTLKEECSLNSQKRKGRKVVFTISPAALADLTRVLVEQSATDVGDSAALENTVLRKISNILEKRFRARLVLDGNIPLQISLLESALEFCQRYQYVYGGFHSFLELDKSWTRIITQPSLLDPRIDVSTPSIALSATETRFLLKHDEIKKNTLEYPSSTSNENLEAIEVKHHGGMDPRLPFVGYTRNSTSMGDSRDANHHRRQSRHVLPMLASSCPGFVCFVEKTAKDAVPNLCSVKSPMAIAGSLIKHGWMNKILEPLKRYKHVEDPLIECLKAFQNDDCDCTVYHVSIMPCHDKKLEAERKDLAWERFNHQEELLVPDVDLVITTYELLGILMETELNFSASDDIILTETNLALLRDRFSKVPIDSNCCTSTHDSNPGNNRSRIPPAMKGTGSYADFIFRFAASALFGHEIPFDEPLPWKKGGLGIQGESGHHRIRTRGKRNNSDDNSELCLFRHSDGTFSCEGNEMDDECVLRFATAYGFKNIQLLMSSVGSDAMKLHHYHYVEAMACPSGCLNGGGQVRNSKLEKPSDTREKVMNMSNFVQEVIPWLKPGDIELEKDVNAQGHLHTRFHVVPKLELSTGATSGVAIDDTHW